MVNKIENLLKCADKAHEQENYIKELDFLKQTLNLLKESDKKERAEIYEKIGANLHLLRRNQEAKEYFDLAMETLSHLSVSDAAEMIWSINYRLGQIFIDEKNYKEALYYNLKAYEYTGNMCSEDAYMVITAIGVTYENLENFDEAIKFYLKALDIANRDLSNDDRCMVLQFIGDCYENEGEERKAFDYYGEVFSMDPNYDGGWYLFYRYAQLAYRFRKFDTSITYFQKAIDQAPSDQNNYLQAAYQCLGYNYVVKKEYKKALVELSNAVKVKVNSSNRLAGIYLGMAQSYFGLNKIGKTIKFAMKALNEQFDEEIEEKAYFLLAFSYGTYGINKNGKKEEFYTEKLKSTFPNSAYIKDLEKFW